MASGDTLLIFTALHNAPPSSSYATFDTRGDQHAVLDFDDTDDESAIFEAKMPQNYDGGGVDVIIHWTATDTNTGHECYWDAAFENDASQDIDSDGFAAVNSQNDSPNGTSGIETRTTISFADGADMDSVTAGDRFRLKITRDADNANDDMTGDAEVGIVEIQEA